MKFTFSGVLSVIAIVVAITPFASQFFAKAPEAGGTRLPNGISADSTQATAGQVRGTTLTITGASTLSGSITGGTTNTATTSISSIGCFQTVATSTATPIKFYPGSTNLSATTTYNGATIQGYVVWTYGTCP